MNARLPIHALEENLAAARLHAIEELASAPGRTEIPSKDALARLALLHTALMAVRDAIAAQSRTWDQEAKNLWIDLGLNPQPSRRPRN
jgi:hypothetical protein